MIQKLIQEDAVRLNDQPVKASTRVRMGDVIRVHLPVLHHDVIEAEDIPLEILYEDGFMAVVNKPPGMVTHPARSNWTATWRSRVE